MKSGFSNLVASRTPSSTTRVWPSTIKSGFSRRDHHSAIRKQVWVVPYPQCVIVITGSLRAETQARDAALNKCLASSITTLPYDIHRILILPSPSRNSASRTTASTVAHGMQGE